MGEDGFRADFHGPPVAGVGSQDAVVQERIERVNVVHVAL